jgi:hypothetical protein
MIPSDPDVYSLGSDGFRWKDVWVTGGSVHVGGATISADGSNKVNINNGLVVQNGANISGGTTPLTVQGGNSITAKIGSGQINYSPMTPGALVATGISANNIGSMLILVSAEVQAPSPPGGLPTYANAVYSCNHQNGFVTLVALQNTYSAELIDTSLDVSNNIQIVNGPLLTTITKLNISWFANN